MLYPAARHGMGVLGCYVHYIHVICWAHRLARIFEMEDLFYWNDRIEASD